MEYDNGKGEIAQVILKGQIVQNYYETGDILFSESSANCYFTYGIFNIFTSKP